MPHRDCHAGRKRSCIAGAMRVPSEMQLRSEAERFCDMCGGEIHRGAAFHAVSLAPHEAAALLDVDDPWRVPTWTQLPNGIVRLDICGVCRSWGEDPAGMQ